MKRSSPGQGGPLLDKLLQCFCLSSISRLGPHWVAYRLAIANLLLYLMAVCTGLRLIGFKSADCLKNYHQLRGSTFVYPDEKTQPGSATAFIALHDRLLKRGLLACCSLVRNKSAEPRMVAALAQQEEIDDRGNQVCTPDPSLQATPTKSCEAKSQEDVTDS